MLARLAGFSRAGFFTAILMPALLTLLAGCGGGGGGGGGTGPTPPSGLSYPTPQTFTTGVLISPIVPTVTGSVSSYSVTPALPAGLSINASTGQISGTPTQATTTTQYTITATNDAGSTTFDLSITVAGTAPTDLSYPSPAVLSVGVPMPVLSATVTGTVTSYSVSPALPAGLSLNSTTGQISGTPIAPSAASNYVITAQNAAGSTTFTLSLAVLLSAPSSLSYSSPQNYIQGVPIAALSPSVTGLVTSYSVSPALPAGLGIDPTTGQITGTPTTVTGTSNYVITAANGSGSTNFKLSITVLIPPPSGLAYASPQTYIVGTAIAPLSPTAAGVVTSYSISPSLPAGLTLNPTTGQITGTPTAAAAMTNYVVTATNSTGSTNAILTITVLIPPPRGLSYPSPQTFTAGTPITPLNPSVTGTVSSYFVQPGLPAGLSINASTGQISGTPTTTTPAANYVITATNGTGSTTFTLSITVRMPPPSALTYRSPQTYYVGTAITPLSPSVNGTVTSYTVAPALPAGLSIDPGSGQISGTPSAAAAAANYTITASNSSGSTTFNLSITVVLLPPRALSYPNPQGFAVGTAIKPINPFVVGVVTSYSASPALPAGLTLDTTTGQISGTPAAVSSVATYTITASNSAGSTSFGLSISVVLVGVTPAKISRIVAAGTPVVIELAVQGQSLSAPVFATASDSFGLFGPAVTVAANGNGFTMALTTSKTIIAGHYTGNVTLQLCRDAACATPQTPSLVAIPFDVEVLSATTTWPGNNATALAPWPNVPDWTMFQGNAAHTGYVPVSLDPNSFSTRWQGPTLNNSTGYNGAFAQTLTTDADQLYIAYGNTPTLYALKELDGTQVWQYSFSGLAFPSVNPSSEANATVYVAAGQQSSTYMFALNETDGSVVFKSQMSSQWEHYYAPTIGSYGVYTNAGTYGGLFGFSFSGTQLFFDGLAQQSAWTPAVDSTYVYSYTGALTVADAVTGAVQATITDPTFTNYVYYINGSAVLGAPGSVFAAAYANSFLNGGGIGNTLLDFDVTNQSVAWKIAGDYPSTPAYHAGIVYAANNNPVRVEARSESSGSLLWSWTPPQAGDTGFNSEVLLTDTMILVSTNLATYGIDLTTHQTVWSYPMSGRLALSRNGILYIQGVGPLTAINVK